MMNSFILLIISTFAIIITGNQQPSDSYHEELFIKPFPTGHVYTYFQFTTKWPINDQSLRHTRLIPKSAAELFLQYNLKELHVSMTNGLWRYKDWGYPVEDAAPGAELWAWFDGPNLNRTDVDDQWTNLCGVLSGLLCASFNSIGKSNTIEPKYSLRPQYTNNPLNGRTSGFIRYASLPQEIVCTENLTPWKKLLPCNSLYGFSSLLNSAYIHTSNYHSLGLHTRVLCNQASCMLEFKQTVSLVFDLGLVSQNKDWSLRKMFGQGLNGGCPLSATSNIYVDVTDGRYELTPPPTTILTSHRGGVVTRYGTYDVKQLFPNKMFNIAGIFNANDNEYQVVLPPPLYAKRFTLGIGQERGKIVTVISNTHWTSLNVIIQENIAWYVQIYLHTLKLTRNGKEDELLKSEFIHYEPGRLRELPYNLEIGLKIPARSSIEVILEFDYVFLNWLEYPPDANHGFYISSAIITSELPIGKNYTAIPVDGQLFSDSFNATKYNYIVAIRTAPILISLPTPDFSMPYNVICLACTAMAMAFGPIHNFATKKIVVAKGKMGRKSLFSIFSIFNIFKRKKSEE